MKKIVAAIVLLLIALGVFLWQLPATFVVAMLPAQTAKFMQLHRVSGTVWQGRALFSVIGVAPAIPLAWACRPSLSMLGVRCDVRDGVDGTVTLDALGGALQLDHLTALVPVQYAMSASVGASASGGVADIKSARLSPQAVTINGALRATEASYRAGGADIPLGDVSADCAPAPDARSTACKLTNRGGSGRLDGSITLTPSSVSGNLELTPAAGPTQRLVF